VTTLHDFGGVILGRPLDAFLGGSHNFMVIAFGSSVKWPLLSGRSMGENRRTTYDKKIGSNILYSL
jgi:hypothetical protein